METKTQTLMYAVKIGEPDWAEEVITVTANDPVILAKAETWATDNGFDRFRIATIDLTTPPDFTKAVTA